MTAREPEAQPAQLFTAAQLEAMRNIGLRLDRTGQFWQHDQPVTHAGLARALLRWLDRVDERDVVRLDEHRFAFVTVEDTHLRAKRLWWADEVAWVAWDDDREEALSPEGLTLTADGSFTCRCRDGRLTGRIRGTAQHALIGRVEEANDRYVLPLAGQRVDLGPIS